MPRVRAPLPGFLPTLVSHRMVEEDIGSDSVRPLVHLVLVTAVAAAPALLLLFVPVVSVVSAFR